MSAIAFALGTSWCYGVANFFAPLVARRHSASAVLVVGQTVALLVALVALVASGDRFPGVGPLAVGLLAGAGNAVGLVGYLRAVEHGPISLVASIGATGAVLPVAYDLLGGRALSAWEAVGLLLAIAGVALAARRPTGHAAAGVHDLRRCVLLALASSAGFGVLLIAMPHAAAAGRWWALADARAVILIVVLAVAASGPRAQRPLSLGALALLAAPGTLLLTGTLLYTLAAERGSLAIVSVLASTSPAITVALAFVVLGERVAVGQRRGIGAILVGVGILAAAK